MPETKKFQFRAQLRLFQARDGGRSTAFRSGNWLHFYFGLKNSEGDKIYNGARVILEGKDWAEPGDTCYARIVPLAPEPLPDVIHTNLEFDILDGFRLIGRGRVLGLGWH